MHRTLADEILDALPALMDEHERGPLARDVARYLAADVVSVRNAFDDLEASGLAKIVRRGKGLHLVPTDYPHKICPVCRVEFDHKTRETCSRSCGVKLSWRKPGARERRSAGIRLSKQTPEAKARNREHNRRRWSNPEEHEKLSEQNRREWSDPIKAARRSVSIKKAMTPERRGAIAEMRRREWADSDNRKKRTKAIRRALSAPEYRAAHSERMKARWRDPALREKYLAAVKANGKKAVAAVKGKKQPPEQVAKRVAAQKATKARKRKRLDLAAE